MAETELSRVETEARRWLAEDPDPTTRAELESLLAANDTEALAERFAAPLAFGTAGLRGIVGAGPGRMNVAVIRRVTAGLCAHLAGEIEDAQKRGVVVAYDGRSTSRQFALEAISVITGAGFEAHFIDRPAPTPLGAYAVSELGAAAGIVVTASHNPPQYNGYKVYWADGAQIVPPHDAGIAAKIDWTGPLAGLPRVEGGGDKLHALAEDVDERYLKGVRSLLLGPGHANGLRVAYTALHGVGASYVERVMTELGIEAFDSVPDQHEPDGRFPTVAFPNPEEPGAMDKVLALAAEKKSDLAIANDPDADRYAVAVRTASGEYKTLNGNQIGALLGDWILTTHGEGDIQPLVATTIVSSGMLGAIARARGARYAETLTGFKWIARAARDFEGRARFLFGYEEALGYTIGTLVHDKDGISAAAAFCEMAALEKSQGRTVLDRLEDLQRAYGIFATDQVSVVLEGVAGARRIASVMDSLRADPPGELGGQKVTGVRDLLAGRDDLPKANVLIFELGSGDRVRVRPSGTEPKLKLYYEAREAAQGKEPIADAEDRARARIGQVNEALLRRCSLEG